MPRRLAKRLLVLYVLLGSPYPLLAAAPGTTTTIEKTPQQIRPPLQTPSSPKQPYSEAFSPRDLTEAPVISYPRFQIGHIDPSEWGFRRCSDPPGFLGYDLSWAGGITHKEYRHGHLCARGLVRVTQQNSIFDMTGKKLRLWVTAVDMDAAWVLSGGAVSLTSVYELTFRRKDYVTFLVDFASGYSMNQSTIVDEVNKYFAQGMPVKIEAQYEGKTYDTLNCIFRSPNKMDCP